MPKENAYKQALGYIFEQRPQDATDFRFKLEDVRGAAQRFSVKNVPDILYNYRYRGGVPDAVVAATPEGMEWVIRGVGKGLYRMTLVPQTLIEPTPAKEIIKIPDATPEIVAEHALTDEQAVLAKIRYNRLLDIFLGITCYSLQNHLRTTVRGRGQVETDEIYVGVDSSGAQFVVPVQAKSKGETIGRVQIEQDICLCREKFPGLICRPVATQSVGDEVIALFELAPDENGEVRVRDEKHYRLVQSSEISEEDLARFRGARTGSMPHDDWS
jgi:hypothetical protein